MGLLDRSPRRSAGGLLPWIALLAVSVFALVQVRERSRLARREQERASAAGATPPALPSVPPAPPVPDFQARAAALESEAAALRARVAELERAGPPVDAAALLADASSSDPVRRARAQASAQAGGKALLRPLEQALEEPDAVRAAPGVLLLARHLPAAPARTALITQALAALGAASGPAELGAIEALRSDADALEQALLSAASGTRRLALLALGPDLAPLRPEQAERAGAALLARWTPRAPDAELARALGTLRVRAAAPQLAAVGPSASAPARAAAAWALARLVPLAPEQRAAAAASALALVEHADLAARQAGLTLAEALLAETLQGERLRFAPDAPLPERTAQVAALRARLSAMGR